MRMQYLTILFLLTAAAGTAAAENFYESYTQTERLAIADAYLAVAEQYESLGEAEKAAAFKAIAQEASPGIADRRPPETPAETARETAAAPPVRPAGREPSAVRYYFSKLLRGLFAENLPEISAVLSTRLYLPGYDQGVAKAEVEAFLKETFASRPLEKIDPASLYVFDRYFIKKEGSAWTAKIGLTPRGAEIMEKALGFPGECHIFYFREYREGWRLIALKGETPPEL